jgi:hypothetical protein
MLYRAIDSPFLGNSQLKGSKDLRGSMFLINEKFNFYFSCDKNI